MNFKINTLQPKLALGPPSVPSISCLLFSIPTFHYLPVVFLYYIYPSLFRFPNWVLPNYRLLNKCFALPPPYKMANIFKFYSS